MMINRLKFLIIGLAGFNIMPATTQIILAAETASILTITVGLSNSSGIEFIAPPPIIASVKTTTNTTTLATTVQALQESLGLPQTVASGFSAHTATANASMSVNITPGNDDAIASFTISQKTSATAFASEPFFARSMSFAQGTAGWWLLRQDEESSIDAALNLTWDFKDWLLQASPMGSLAYIQNTVNIWQVTEDGLHHDEVGFLSYRINDQAFGLPVSPDMSDRLIADIPLAFNENNELALVVSSTHTQMSYEAPPRAVIQVEAAAGYRATADGSYPEVHWYSSSNTLKFDPIPIDLLLLGSGNASHTNLANDSLLGGFLEIGDFTYIGELDGRRYFSGSDLTLIDNLKQPVLTAVAPTLVLEDALYAHQGFNGFAPILLFEQNSAPASSWLEDFLSYLTVDSFYLPELFIGFDSTQFKNESFSAPVSALLSFAGPLPPAAPGTVPEPSALWLLGGGLTLLLWRRRMFLETNGKRQVNAVIWRIVS